MLKWKPLKKQTNKQGFCLFPSGVEQTGTKFKPAVIWMGEWIGSWSSLSVIAIACAPRSFGWWTWSSTSACISNRATIMYQSIFGEPTPPNIPPPHPVNLQALHKHSFAVDGKISGAGTLELKCPAAEKKKEGKCPTHSQHCSTFHWSYNRVVDLVSVILVSISLG